MAQKPLLDKEVLFPYYRQGEEILTEEDIKFTKLMGGRKEKLHKLSENEILFEAANTQNGKRPSIFNIIVRKFKRT